MSVRRYACAHAHLIVAAERIRTLLGICVHLCIWTMCRNCRNLMSVQAWIVLGRYFKTSACKFNTYVYTIYVFFTQLNLSRSLFLFCCCILTCLFCRTFYCFGGVIFVSVTLRSHMLENVKFSCLYMCACFFRILRPHSALNVPFCVYTLHLADIFWWDAHELLWRAFFDIRSDLFVTSMCSQ